MGTFGVKMASDEHFCPSTVQYVCKKMRGQVGDVLLSVFGCFMVSSRQDRNLFPSLLILSLLCCLSKTKSAFGNLITSKTVPGTDGNDYGFLT